MISSTTILLLALLWALRAYFCIESAPFAYAFKHNILTAVLPGSPLGLDRREMVERAEAVTLVYGTPFLFAFLTSRSIRSGGSFFRRSPAE